MRGAEILADLWAGRRQAKDKLHRQHAVVELDSSSSEQLHASEEVLDSSDQSARDASESLQLSAHEESQPAMEGHP